MYVADKFLLFGKQIKDAKEEIKMRIDSLESTLEEAATDRHGKLTNQHKEIEDVLERVVGNVEDSSRATSEAHRQHERALTSFSTTAIYRLERLEDQAHDLHREVTDAKGEILTHQNETVATLSDQIRVLSEQMNSARLALIDQLKGLAQDGKTAIDSKDIATIERWIAKANYMVRSLEIPTEEGLLKNTSVVKYDLRKAMEGFAKEQHYDAKALRQNKHYDRSF